MDSENLPPAADAAPIRPGLQPITEVKPRTPRARFRFIDLFAEIGGLRQGFEGLGGRCVLTSEWNQLATTTYKANFVDTADHIFAGDITQVDALDIPEHEVLLAGVPCQSFSIAGVSKKYTGTRARIKCEAQGTLFFDVARITEHNRPRAFLLENVKNLINHDRGNTFAVIHRPLREELGYRNLHYRVLDARAWVPQHRERIFIVGFLDENAFSFDNLRIPPTATHPRMSLILHPEDGTEPPDEPYTLGPRGIVNQKYTLTGRLCEYLQNYAEKHRRKGMALASASRDEQMLPARSQQGTTKTAQKF